MPRLRAFQLPLSVPVVRGRQQKAVGVANRGRFLAGRNDPADIPIAEIKLQLRKEDERAQKWYSKNHKKFKQPSDFTLRAFNPYAPTGGRAFTQFDPVMDNSGNPIAAAPAEYQPLADGDSDESSEQRAYQDLSLSGNTDGYILNTGQLPGTKLSGPRPETKKTWWIFRDDKVKEFLDHLATLPRWNKLIDRVRAVITFYYRQSLDDVGLVAHLGGYLFESEDAVKLFRKRMVELGYKLHGPDPDFEETTKTKSLKSWLKASPDLKYLPLNRARRCAGISEEEAKIKEEPSDVESRSQVLYCKVDTPS